MLAYFTKAGFQAHLNKLLGRTVALADLTVANSCELNPGPASKREVRIAVSFPATDGVTRENRFLYYNRMDLVELNNAGYSTTLVLPEDTTVHQLLPFLQRNTGIEFTTYDLEDLPVVAQTSLSSFTLTLKAKAGSPRFKGTCEFVTGRKPTLASVFGSVNLGSV